MCYVGLENIPGNGGGRIKIYQGDPIGRHCENAYAQWDFLRGFPKIKFLKIVVDIGKKRAIIKNILNLPKK